MKIKKSYTKKVKTFAEVAKIFKCTWSCHGQTEQFVNEYFTGDNAAILVASSTFGGARIFTEYAGANVCVLHEKYYNNGKIVIVIENVAENIQLKAELDANGNWGLVPLTIEDDENSWENGVSSWRILQKLDVESYFATSGSSGSVLKYERTAKGKMKVTYKPPVYSNKEDEYYGTYRQYFMGEVE